MYKSQKIDPCTKCLNHGKTVVNHCPYWDCQCTSCKQTDILAALKLEHSQLMRGLHPGSLQKIGITENKKAFKDKEGTLTNKVKVIDERKMGNIEPVKLDYNKSLSEVDENENCVQKNVGGKLIKKESVNYMISNILSVVNTLFGTSETISSVTESEIKTSGIKKGKVKEELKHKSKDGFGITSEYIEFENDIIESLPKPNIVIADALDEQKYDCEVKNSGIKDKKNSCSVGERRNVKDEIIEDGGEPTHYESSLLKDNLNLKLSMDTSKRNALNPTHPHLGVKELPIVNPKRETIVEKDQRKTRCPQSSPVIPIGTLNSHISSKGIKVVKIDDLLKSNIIEKEGSGLKNLKDIKSEVQKFDPKETDNFLCTQYYETNKIGQEMQKHRPQYYETNKIGQEVQKHRPSQSKEIIKVEDIPKIKSDTVAVSSFDIEQENCIQNSTIFPCFETKDEKGEHIRNVKNVLDPLITVEFEVQQIKDVKVDTAQFEDGNDEESYYNDPDLKRPNCLNNEKKQLKSKRLKFEQKKMPEKPKRRVYMKQNLIPRFKFGEGGLHDVDRKDRGYRKGGGYGGNGGYDRDNSGYSIDYINGGDRDYRGYNGKGRWGGYDEYDGGGYREENVHGVSIDGGDVHGVGINGSGYGVSIDGGGYSKEYGFCGGRYERGRNNGVDRGGGYQGDIEGRNDGGYRSEYGRTDCSGYGNGRNSGSYNGGGFIGGGGRGGGRFEENYGDCGVYGKGKDGISDYGRNERGSGYGAGGQY